MNDYKPLSNGSILRVSGTVQKFARREGVCRLVIEPGGSGTIVFANFGLSDAETLKARNVRKGSVVQLVGTVTSFGSSAVCLAECALLR